jgi:hypothetical protein
MKQLILAASLALASVGAQATFVATAANDTGGAIQVSNIPCNAPMAESLHKAVAGLDFGYKGPGYLVINTNRADDVTNFGCSFADKEGIAIHWANGSTVNYSLSNFRLIGTGQ